MDSTPYLPGSLSAQSVRASVQAGFASPAEDHAAKRIDVLEHVVKHPQAICQMKVRSESMRNAGIADGEMLIVDRAIARVGPGSLRLKSVDAK